MIILLALMGLAVQSATAKAASNSSSSIAASLLHEAGMVSGEARLSRYAGLILTGPAKRYGLRGRYRKIVDLHAGRFWWQANYGVTSEGEGLSKRSRWRRDASGGVHPLDSDEAKTIAITEAYLARRGYLREESARVALVDPIGNSQRSPDYRVAVTPPGGRTALLQIGRIDHLVHRIDFQGSERIDTVRYDDYRRINGVVLPFSVRTDDGDGPASIHVASYHFLTHVGAGIFRPPARPDDSRIRSGSAERTSLEIDRSTGFPIIFAAIDGHQAAPFIIDTGGHDILTPAAARQFHLNTVGQGVSFGGGAGVTPTAFTRIRSIKIGDAEMTNQPFVVLDLDLGSVPDVKGRDVPIAGILGLELFERFVVTIDFARHEFVLRRSSQTYDAQAAMIPIQFTSDEPLVNAQIDGRGGSFAVDTGNNVGLIVYRHWIAAAHLPEIRPERKATAGSSVGGPVSFQHARAHRVQIGNVGLTNVPIFIADAHSGSMSARSEAGSIGVPNLAHDCVTFDYAAGNMTLRP